MATRDKTTNKIMSAVRTLVEEDEKNKMEKIVNRVGVSEGSLYEILTNHLGLREKFACWVPDLLSKDQKKWRVYCS